MGSLVIIGTGIQSISHLTLEARKAATQADVVLYSLADPCTEQWLVHHSKAVKNLSLLYKLNKPRSQIYTEMVEIVLAHVRSGLKTCLALYGHPGMFVSPSHELLRRAREENFPVKMCPGISAIDCLFADLGIDPATHGLEMFGATELLLRKCSLTSDRHVVLWQVGMVGNPEVGCHTTDVSAIELLLDYLLTYYPPAHRLIHYKASLFSVSPPSFHSFQLASLMSEDFDTLSSLYIPPLSRRPVSTAMLTVLQTHTHVEEPSTPPAFTELDLRSALGILDRTPWARDSQLSTYLASLSEQLEIDQVGEELTTDLLLARGLNSEEVSAIQSRDAATIKAAIIRTLYPQ